MPGIHISCINIAPFMYCFLVLCEISICGCPVFTFPALICLYLMYQLLMLSDNFLYSCHIFTFLAYHIRVSHKTERILIFLVSQLSWLVFVCWFQRHKLLYCATTSSIPSFCLKKCEKYKGFSKFIKRKNCRRVFQFLYF